MINKNISNIFGHKTLLAGFVLVSFITLVSFTVPEQAPKRKLIRMLQSGYTTIGDQLGPGTFRFINNVILEHNEVLMYCDSAHVTKNSSEFRAYGHIHINQGDTLHLYGDSLRYNGNTNWAKMRGKVKMVDKETELTTRFLDYNTITGIAKYYNKGVIVNLENTLKSVIGIYYSNEKKFIYSDSVILYNKEYTMYTDTLRYFTNSSTSFFEGPTRIYSKKEYSYCEDGWYNTKLEKGELIKNALVQNAENTITADSIYFDRKNKLGNAKNNITITDSVNNTIIKGDYAKYTNLPEEYFITKKALLIQFDKNKDSLFVHSDTLYTRTYPREKDSTAVVVVQPKKDSLSLYQGADSTFLAVNLYDKNDTPKQETDTTIREIKLYHGVRFFKSDVQGLCDSVFYSSKDSVIQMHIKPVLWSGKSQMTASKIEMYFEKKQINRIEFYNSSLIISYDSLDYYNQVRGRDMTAFIKDNKLQKAYIRKDSHTLYFNKDKAEYVGVNNSTSTDVNIYFNNNDVTKINYIKAPKSVLTPIDQAKPEQMQFDNFIWLKGFRPTDKLDVFRMASTDSLLTDKKYRAVELFPTPAPITDKEDSKNTENKPGDSGSKSGSKRSSLGGLGGLKKR